MEAKAEKIKIRVNVSPRYKEIEVSFPYFVKDAGNVIKFFDKRKGVMVTDYSFSRSVQWMDMPEEWLSFKPTTEEIFNKAFDKVMNFLIKNK